MCLQLNTGLTTLSVGGVYKDKYGTTSELGAAGGKAIIEALKVVILLAVFCAECLVLDLCQENSTLCEVRGIEHLETCKELPSLLEVRVSLCAVVGIGSLAVCAAQQAETR